MLRRAARAVRGLATRLDARAARWILADGASGVAVPALWIWHVLARTSYAVSVTETVRRLVQDGRYDDAFHLLSAGILMGHHVRPKCASMARQVAFWLAGAGFLGEAEAYIRRLAPTRGKLTRRLLADLWATHALLDPRVEPELRRALWEADIGDLRLRRRLRYFALLCDDTYAISRLYDRHANNGRWTSSYIRLDQLAIAAASGTLEPSAEVLDFLLQVPQMQRPLVIDCFLLAHASAHLAAHEAACALRLARAVDEGGRELAVMLGDHDRTLAIVGNSPSALGRAQGMAIDEHDVVVRFNVAPATGEYARDVGSKTDIHVINQGVLNEPGVLSLRDSRVLLTGPDWEVFAHHRAAVETLLDQGCRLALVPRDIRQRLMRMLYATPSSGLQACVLACALRGYMTKGMSFHGFAFTDQVGDKAFSANYFRDSWPNARHNWRGEAKAFQRLVATGRAEGEGVTGATTRYINHGTLSAFRPRRIGISGDHSMYHCGSAAVTRRLREALEKYGELVAGDDSCDFLIVNGEGSMHHDSPHFLQKMKLMERALARGTRVYLVNSVWQANGNDWDHVLRRIEKIVVRETLSRQELRERHGIAAAFYPDLSFYAKVQPPNRAVDFGGRIVMTDFYSHEFSTFTRWTGAEGLRYPYINMREWQWDDLVASLRTAELLVTGRHHAVYAACRAGIPFVAFPGNTHKIEGLLASARSRIPMCRSRTDLPEAIAWARANRHDYEQLSAWLSSFPPWDPFA